MGDTNIQWTATINPDGSVIKGKTWNPTTGCSKVSSGCKNCFAARMAKRLAGRCGYPAAPHQFDVTLHPERLELPLHWKKPCKIFVDSMSDLFHEDVPTYFIAQVFAVMAIAKEHTFQILTKRPDWMPDTLDEVLSLDVEQLQEQYCAERGWCPQDFNWPLPNVWIGVSVEDQQTADERIPWLLKTPAAVRFVSVEPMLELVDLWKADYPAPGGGKQGAVTSWPGGLDWVICGGESGPGARLMHPDWARSLRDQCQAAGTAFFLKQMSVDGKLVKMPELDGRVWDEFPG